MPTASVTTPNGTASTAPDPESPPLDALRDRLAEGDTTAFEQIFRRLSKSVFRYVCGMVQDEALAHDLTQDTFAKLWSVRERMETVDSLRAYVFRMARNRVYNHQRNERTRRDTREHLGDDAPHGSPPTPDQDLDANLLGDLLHEWIDDLPDRQREALTLCRRENLSLEEVADVMVIAPSTVNHHVTRALQHLRERLRTHRPDLLS